MVCGLFCSLAPNAAAADARAMRLAHLLHLGGAKVLRRGGAAPAAAAQQARQRREEAHPPGAGLVCGDGGGGASIEQLYRQTSCSPARAARERRGGSGQARARAGS